MKHWPGWRPMLRLLIAMVGADQSGRANTLGRSVAPAFSRFGAAFADSPRTPQSLVDLGSGAGFPGWCWRSSACRRSNWSSPTPANAPFCARRRGSPVPPVTIHNGASRRCRAHAVDVVTARGCAPLDRLLRWRSGSSAPHTTCLFLKGERAEEELTAAGKAWTMAVTRHPSRTDPRGVILSLAAGGP